MTRHIDRLYPKNPSPCNCMNVRRASRAVTQFYDRMLEPSGLTIAQLSLLRHVDAAQPVTISQLAKTMRIDRTTLNRNMKPLAEAEWITITPGRDSRTRHIAITAAGKETMNKAWALWGEAQETLRDYLGENDLSELVRLLSRLEALAP